MSVFSRFAPRLQEAIASQLGWKSLRPVQELAGEALLDGANAVVLAPTAGGKTEASMFPVLSDMVSDPPGGLAALYIAPIKALLNNQAERLATYTRMVGNDRFVWHGDVGASARRRFLAEPATVLMTTPESLEVMLVSPRVDAKRLFGDLSAVVIDEVHALAGSDRGAHLMSVLERLAALSRHDVQRVGLSATVGNPATISAWLQGSSARDATIVDPPHPPARRELLVLYRSDAERLAQDAAKLARGIKSLYFCQSRAMTEQVADAMQRSGTDVFVHHSSVSAEERQRAEKRFSHGRDACIVCTSTLELGIDVGDLDRVLQNEAPDTVGSFLQRMGRTGRRAGTTANATFFCESEDAVLQATALIELARQKWVEDVDVTDRCWPVLVHQLLAMALAEAGVQHDDAWEHFQRVPDFAGITRAEYNRLLGWMLRDKSLEQHSGRLVLGPKAERRFGRRNFMELYAVFESPQSYDVTLLPSLRPLGSLSQAFVDRLVEHASTFVLGGRGWLVRSIDHKGREIKVEPAPRGRRPTWGGIGPSFLGQELCAEIKRILMSDEGHTYLHASAAEVLAEKRQAFEGVLSTGSLDLWEDAGEVRWWTFAGGRINNTLRYALAAVGGEWTVVADNFGISVRGGADRARVAEAIWQLSVPEFWDDSALWGEVAAGLPNYRLSKFQSLMPPWVEREMLASALLDIEGAWRHACRPPADARLKVVLADWSAPTTPTEDPPSGHQPTRPIRWIRTDEELARACAALAAEPFVALDVETTLRDRRLCLVQLGTPTENLLIDPFSISDLGPLAVLMANPSVVKVIHNASFEKSVLGQHDIEIVGIFDTLKASRDLRGKVEGGHSLGAVCSRELGIEIDKSEQCSNWRRRPLTGSQEAYAALDVEVLVNLLPRLRDGRLF